MGYEENKKSIVERLSEIITLKVNKRLNKEGLELQKMKLGFEILLINISKFIVIFAVAAVFNLLLEVSIMTLTFALIRKNAFGLHSKSSIVCTISSVIMFVLGSYLSSYIKLNNYAVLVTFLMTNLLLYKYSPGDTESHPLLGEKLRNKLKRDSVLTGIFLMLIALIIPNGTIKTLISLAVAYEVISILPITYKILKRGYKNYEKYERAII
ncbi:MAG: accessory gene regulator B family protein [Bacillota bacterium]|nr:accessory gene regulator B family protein [Bacillota bacterium]